MILSTVTPTLATTARTSSRSAVKSFSNPFASPRPFNQFIHSDATLFSATANSKTPTFNPLSSARGTLSSSSSPSPSSSSSRCLRPIPVSQLTSPSRSACISKPQSFSAMLRSSPRSSQNTTLLLHHRAFSSQPGSSGSRAATVSAETNSRYSYAKTIAAIAALGLAIDLYLALRPSSSSSSYSYENPVISHNYGSKAEFTNAIQELKAYFRKASTNEWHHHVSQDDDELERRGFDLNGHRTISEGLTPSVVVWPRHTEDVVEIVKFIAMDETL